MSVIAFRAKRPMNYEMFRPLHARLLADARMKIVLYGKSAGRSDAGLLDLAGALPARCRPNWLAKYTRPDVLFSADFLMATKRARTSIQIFHGVSIKNYFLNERIHDYDHVFATGPYMIRRYQEHGFFEEGDPKLLHVGLPKTDRLTDGSLIESVSWNPMDSTRRCPLFSMPRVGGKRALWTTWERHFCEHWRRCR